MAIKQSIPPQVGSTICGSSTAHSCRPSREAKTNAMKALRSDLLTSEEESSSDEDELENILDDRVGSEICVESDNDGESSDDGISDDEDALVALQQFSDTEDEESDGDEPHLFPRTAHHQTPPSLKSPSGEQWCRMPSTSGLQGRPPAYNIFRGRPGGPVTGVHPESEKEGMFMFLDNIIEECVRFTNLKGRRMVRQHNRMHTKQKIWKNVDRLEMDAFVGLHIIAGAYRAHYRFTRELWSDQHGQPIFRATMSETRFRQLKAALRTDDTKRRDPSDKLAPVRHVWELFLKNIQKWYNVGPLLTIDEQLLEYHGRVAFRQYIGSKPGKFGMKIFWICDAETAYAVYGVVYLGEKTLSTEEKCLYSSVTEAITMKCILPFLDCGRNVTLDNWFTSLSLARTLSRRNTTLVGTLRSTRREIPEAAKALRGRQKKSVEHFSCGKAMLVSYWDKGSKPVLLMSTMHDRPSTSDSGLPEVVDLYNKTKSGVDILDRAVRSFSTKRKCRRWPYAFLFNMVDIALHNAFIIHHVDYPTISRYTFLVNTAMQLCQPHAARRVGNYLPKKVLDAAKLCGFISAYPAAHPSPDSQQRARCSLCPRSSDRKVQVACSRCNKFCCVEHRHTFCSECNQ